MEILFQQIRHPRIGDRVEYLLPRGRRACCEPRCAQLVYHRPEGSRRTRPAYDCVRTIGMWCDSGLVDMPSYHPLNSPVVVSVMTKTHCHNRLSRRRVGYRALHLVWTCRLCHMRRHCSNTVRLALTRSSHSMRVFSDGWERYILNLNVVEVLGILLA